MMISLLGYMGSGKTHISKLLSEKLDFRLIDLDKRISQKNHATVSEIFEKKGELYFRKLEREVLEEVLAGGDRTVLSLGGGTPCYYNNMEVINQNSVSFYLRTSVAVLSERLLRKKQKRPLISRIENDDLPEFVAKHLFDRSPYYHKAQFVIDTTGKEPDAIVEEIISKLL